MHSLIRTANEAKAIQEIDQMTHATQQTPDAGAFFSQDDWEFELDTMKDRSREALLAHLARAPQGHDTAGFLKGFLMDSTGVTYTPFGE